MLAKTLSIYAHIVVLVYPNNWSTHQNIITSIVAFRYTWWRHQMETISALLALCARNSPVTGEFPSQRPGRGALMFSLICAWINVWINNREAGDLRRNRAHYDVIVMIILVRTRWKGLFGKGNLVHWPLPQQIHHHCFIPSTLSVRLKCCWEMSSKTNKMALLHGLLY